MLGYQIRIAWLSLRRNPGLSLLLVAAIALGIAVSTAIVTGYYLMAQDPIPAKSDRLFYVQMDAWNPDRPFDSDRPEQPPNQLTYTDALAAMASDIPTHQTVMFRAKLTVHPERRDARPFRATTRMCFGDFFRMFDVPFRFGSPWGAQADTDAATVAVIDHETNLRLFGGEDSVGKTLRIEDRTFTITGVLAPWVPSVKFYDVNEGATEAIESIFLPFRLVEPMTIETVGNSRGWRFYPGTSFEDFLASEEIWTQAWVQLDDENQRDAYQGYLDAYAREQQKQGRFGRPLNNRLRNVRDWMKDQEVVPEEAGAMLIIALLFLVVCSVNLIGILLGKFLARAPEIGVRRALGASRSSVFMQHIIECELIGLFGGIIGIGLSTFTLRVVDRWIVGSAYEPTTLDANMVLAGLFLSLVAGLIAGIYPSWRICRVAPAVYLKQQ